MFWRYISNTTHVIFPSRKDVIHFLLKDYDGYIRSFNGKDLLLRNCKTHIEYMTTYTNNIHEFSNTHKDKLKKCSVEASNFLSNLKNPFINTVKILKLPWKFSMITKHVEYGLPHTRGDLIFLPEHIFNGSDTDIIRTLIHEKIHIYQKKYNSLFVESLLQNGYTELGYLSNDRMKNPDINNLVYRHPNGRIMYKRNGVSGLNSAIWEHPYELIAYTISNQA